MLIAFGVENFLSFNDQVVISFIKSRITKHKNHILDGGIKALACDVIYGANASGKSNLLKALYYFVNIVNGNGDLSDFKIGYNRFRFDRQKNTKFFIIFQLERKIYRYSIEFNNDGIEDESLTVLNKKLEEIAFIFKRTAAKVVYSPELEVIEWYKYRSVQRSGLLLSKLRLDGVLERDDKKTELFKQIYFFFDKFVFRFSRFNIKQMPIFYNFFKKSDFKSYLLDMLKAADLGVEEVKYVELSTENIKDLNAVMNIPNIRPDQMLFIRGLEGNFYCFYIENGTIKGEKLTVIHNGQEFDIQQESEGTIKIIELSLMIYWVCKVEKSVLIVDELDSVLHSNLAKFLIKKITDNLGNLKSQMLLTLHDNSLLTHELWRNDEIWLMEKNVDGASELNLLNNLNVRFDKDIASAYAAGVYGGVPMLEE